MALLEINNLHTYYGSIHALKGINLEIEEGQIAAMIGSNGAGKSTTLKSISGLVKARSGEIRFQGDSILGKPSEKIVASGVIQVPEGRGIFIKLSVQENLMMGAYLRKDKNGIKDSLEYVYALLPRLKERANQMGGTLSGGEQQMLAVGRALMAKPKLLMLDEPSMGLAPLITKEIFACIKSLNKEGMTVLLVEQNANLALGICDKAYVIETGNIVLSGNGQELLSDDRVRKTYLGEA